jgi:hypothetical protein
VTDGQEEGYQVVLEIVLPVIAHLLEDEKTEVRSTIFLLSIIIRISRFGKLQALP